MNDVFSGRPIEDVLGRLEQKGCRAESCGPGKWRSRCPVHQGKSKNLSIGEEPDGKVLIHCFHAGENGHPTCTIDAILDSLELSKSDLFPKLTERAPKRKSSKTPPRDQAGALKRRGESTPEAAIAWTIRKLGQPVAYWIYYEEHEGQQFELMRVYRFDLPDGTKTFRPIHPSSEGWLQGDPPGLLPLYWLPELRLSDVIFVVEGEKCVDLVRSMGLIATTSAHGASSPHKTDWSPLAGKTLVLMSDNDIPGRGYMQAVARLCISLDPKPAIRILELPVTGDGHDFEEWYRDVCPDTWSPLDCRIELENLWKRVPLWTPPPCETPPATAPDGDDWSLSLTEWGNAKRLIKNCGDKVRYCYPKGKWMHWDGQRWVDDETGEIWRSTKQVTHQLLIEALACEDTHHGEAILKWALKSHQKKVMSASMELAWSEPGVGVMPDDFDRDPWLLNCPNGVVDLRTGEIRSAKPEDLLSKMTAVAFDPAAHCPRWRKVVSEIFEGDDKLIAYVQRAMGYSLTGDTREHALFFCYGTGRNGKNTILDTAKTVLGDYATIVDPRVFLTAGQGDHPASLADLVGRRFVLTSEVDASQQFAEGLVKRLTGDKTIKARFMHQNPFEFAVHFKIWMLANSKPEIRGQDEGIWSRIRIVPFDVFLAEDKRIKGLSDTLITEEGPGILGWLIEGCRDWTRLEGLAEPEKVTAAIATYRAEQDIVGAFLNQCTKSWLDHPLLRDDAKVRPDTLYGCYLKWCETTGERDVLPGRKFALELNRRGYKLSGTNGQRFRCGLSLCDADETF